MALRTDATSTQSDDARARAIQQQNTTLVWAATQGYESIVKTMLTTPGTNPLATDPTDAYGYTSLHLAAQKGHANVVSVLLEHSDVNAFDKFNDTALTWAIYFNHTNVAKILLKQPQLNVQVENTLGNTALFIAVSYARQEIAIELLKRDDLDLKKHNTQNQTVFSFIQRVRDTPVFNALLRASVKWLFKANKDDVSITILDSLKPYKEHLFVALMQLLTTEADQLNAVKQIIEGKETTALGKVFWYKKSANSINKGTMAKVHAKYLELTKTEQKASQPDTPIIEKPFQYTPEMAITFLAAQLDIKQQPNEHLLQQFSQAQVELLTPAILKILTNHKTELLTAINALPDAKALHLLEQVFDETKDDKKNDRTALGKVFWAGHPDLYEGRLGAAYKCYFELKFPGAMFGKPLKPSVPSLLFGNLFGGKAELKVTLGKDESSNNPSSAVKNLDNL